MKSPARSSSSLPGPTITFSGRDPSCSNLKLEIKICFHSTIKDMLVQRGLKQLACTISQSAHPMAGRLKHLLPNWAQVTQDQWVLNTVQGYSIDFMGVPIQETRPRMGISSVSEQSLIQEEIQKMLLKGAIIELSQTEAAQGFFSSLFLVPKKDGGMRPVINLKQLNKFIPPHHFEFKMEGMHTVKDLLKKGDWLTKVDLRDAYFTIPIHKKDRLFLRFSAQNRHYQFTCLPFGLSCAPWVFTKTHKPALTLLRELGVRLVAYIDNILVMHGGDRATGKRPHPGPDPSSVKPGLHCPSRENGPNSISGNRVPGSTSQFQDHGFATPRSKDKEVTPRNNKAPEN